MTIKRLTSNEEIKKYLTDTAYGWLVDHRHKWFLIDDRYVVLSINNYGETSYTYHPVGDFNGWNRPGSLKDLCIACNIKIDNTDIPNISRCGICGKLGEAETWKYLEGIFGW